MCDRCDEARARRKILPWYRRYWAWVNAPECDPYPGLNEWHLNG